MMTSYTGSRESVIGSNGTDLVVSAQKGDMETLINWYSRIKTGDFTWHGILVDSALMPEYHFEGPLDCISQKAT